ncbi:MAG: metal ABC transporter ATP-binding protein [Planctomycetota bacterium]
MSDSDRVIEFAGVGFSYDGEQPALVDIELSVPRGERLGVLGPNGGGKTTLVKLAMGLLEPDAGTVRVLGGSPTKARESGTLGYVAQRAGLSLTFPISVQQVVELGAVARHRGRRKLAKDAAVRVQRAMELTGADEFADRPIGELSGGQRQRALIARALACGPEVLILDEPTVGIDLPGQAGFARMLEEIRSETGVTTVIVSHDLRALAAGCDRIACVARTLHSHVSPEGLTPALLAEVFRHEIEGVMGEVHLEAHLAASCDDPTHAASARTERAN